MDKKTGTVSVLLAACLWGILGIFVRQLNNAGFDTIQVVAVRSIGAVALLFLYIFFSDRKALKIRWKDFWVFLGTGIGSMVFFNFCYFGSMQRTSLAIAATLLYTAPVFVVIFARLFLGEKLKGKQYAAIVLAIFGCAMVAGVFSSRMAVDAGGLLLGLGAGIGYALYSIFGKVAIKRGYSDVTITFYTFLVAAAATLWSLGEKRSDFLTMGWGTWLAIGGLALFSTVLAYVLYTRGLQHVPAGYASVIACVEPVVATLVSCFLYHESLTPVTIVGIACVLCSAVIM